MPCCGKAVKLNLNDNQSMTHNCARQLLVQANKIMVLQASLEVARKP